MKKYNMWEITKNESKDVQDEVLGSLNGQLEVRLRNLLDDEIRKLGSVLYGRTVDYLALELMCDEELYTLGLNEHSDLTIYRELIYSIDSIKFTNDVIHDDHSDYIYIVITFKDDSPSPAVFELLINFLDKHDESAFLDIVESTLSNLLESKNYRKFI